jgi:hypothetical protein
VNKSFDINKLSKKDRDVLTSRLDYTYKMKKKPEDLQRDIDYDQIKNKGSKNEVMRSSVEKSSSSRRIIENVIERIEGKDYLFYYIN